MRSISFAGLFLCIFGILPGMAQQSAFDHLEIVDNEVRTAHQAKYKIKIDSSLKLLGEFHHQPTYNNKKFNVSFAAFSDRKNIVMIHAETHADGSGGLDYSELPVFSLNDVRFTSREQCASAEDEAELNVNPQIQFVRKKGFDLSLPFYVMQFFVTSQDGKAEVVISYGTRIASCENLTEGFRSQIEKRVRETISVSRLK